MKKSPLITQALAYAQQAHEAEKEAKELGHIFDNWDHFREVAIDAVLHASVSTIGNAVKELAEIDRAEDIAWEYWQHAKAHAAELRERSDRAERIEAADDEARDQEDFRLAQDAEDNPVAYGERGCVPRYTPTTAEEDFGKASAHARPFKLVSKTSGKRNFDAFQKREAQLKAEGEQS